MPEDERMGSGDYCAAFVLSWNHFFLSFWRFWKFRYVFLGDFWPKKSAILLENDNTNLFTTVRHRRDAVGFGFPFCFPILTFFCCFFAPGLHFRLNHKPIDRQHALFDSVISFAIIIGKFCIKFC